MTPNVLRFLWMKPTDGRVARRGAAVRLQQCASFIVGITYYLSRIRVVPLHVIEKLRNQQKQIQRNQ